jgi:hypothetical protein
MKIRRPTIIRKKQCDILWFDAVDNDGIEYAVADYDLIPLRIRTNIFLSLSIVFNIIRLICRYGKDAYYQSIINSCHPRMVITGIHNSPKFWGLAQQNPNIIFLAVQNSRGIFSRRRAAMPAYLRPSIYDDHYISGAGFLACFGSFDVDRFRDAGFPASQLKPIGSIKASMYKKKSADLDSNAVYDVCLIADKLINNSHFIPILEGLSACVRINPTLNIVVAMKRIEGDIEYALDCELIRKYLGARVTFVPLNQKKFTSYDVAERSKVCVGSFSTLLVDVFSFGSIVLACNYTGFDEFDLDLPSECSCDSVNENGFCVKLFTLLNCDHDEFRTRNYAAMCYHNEYQGKPPSHERLRMLIDSMLRTSAVKLVGESGSY